MTTQPTCPNCPPGYDCETGNYSYDDFEEIRDEQAARRAADDFHDAVCTGPGVPTGFTCSHPSHARLAAGTEER